MCDAEYLRHSLNVPGAEIAVCVDCECLDAQGNRISYEKRFYVSSLSPDSIGAADLHKRIRGHWQIENCLHFIKDRWWDEDRHPTRRPGLSAVFASLNNAALSVLRLLKGKTEWMRGCADNLRDRPAAMLKVLGFA